MLQCVMKNSPYNWLMKLFTFLWRAMLVLAICAGVGQWWMVNRAHAEAAKLVSRLVPHGKLRYERLWPYLWGGGRVWGLSFESDGLLGLSMQIPQGQKFFVRELEVKSLRLDGDGELEFIHGMIHGLEIPVAESHAPPVTQPHPADHELPRLADMGYAQISMDVEFEARYISEANLALLRVNALAPDMGHAFIDAQLEGTPGVFTRAQDQIVLRKVVLDFADAGLLARGKKVAVERAKLRPEVWEQALINRLAQLRSKDLWKWEPQSDQALRRLIRNPEVFRAQIDPASDVLLRNIRLYRTADWPVLLGFSLQAEDKFAHPTPGQGLE